ncbi:MULTISPECIES: hypothetical protein [Pseudomonas]|uniref:Uncharacterized protein n=1 Tax=Pseudomonas wuhanensis TaxID=2954098 RepID=A0ABY9GPE1_9PSED|nr:MULTISPECIES: hypothetical protein [unclassified Pseudomonas]WLI11677.1 hypothetical protein PSH65_26630 [Pseudomonas sp. FP603]WLI17518.1 hypothetical protein PSH88_25265 [Pseudomonas sp. FP607]
MERLLESNTVLPNEFHAAYKLCFTIHDVAAQLLVSGIKQGVFITSIAFNGEHEKSALEQADDLLDWLKKSGRLNDEADVLVTMAFPAVLSDILHCIFEALEASRKGKLAIAYMLLRKPFQESLYLLESVIADKESFSKMIADDPSRLRPQNAGGIDGHIRRIQKVLKTIGETSRFNASYIAKLRYDKTENDSFDGICNKAMHLFTDHKSIKTEKYNINFIFSGMTQAMTQWAFLYSRLPYLLLYLLSLIEFIAERFSQTLPSYKVDMDRRIASSLLMADPYIDTKYRTEPLTHLTLMTRQWLSEHCMKNGFLAPEAEHLERMAVSGAFPMESDDEVHARHLLYEQLVSA